MQKTGLEASFGTVDTRYMKDVRPDTGGSLTESGTAWRGERYNAQLALWAWGMRRRE
jgi:hypothetical protein